MSKIEDYGNMLVTFLKQFVHRNKSATSNPDHDEQTVKGEIRKPFISQVTQGLTKQTPKQSILWGLLKTN